MFALALYIHSNKCGKINGNGEGEFGPVEALWLDYFSYFNVSQVYYEYFQIFKVCEQWVSSSHSTYHGVIRPGFCLEWLTTEKQT